MQGMASFARHYASNEGATDKGKISNIIEDLMPNKFVLEAKNVVQDPRLREDDGIFHRPAPHQTVLSQLFNLMQKTERPSWSDFPSKSLGRRIKFIGLFPNHWVRKINRIADLKSGGWINRN